MIVADQVNPYTFVHAFRFIGREHSLVLSKVIEHIQLAGAALGIAMLLALPLGVWLGHLHRGSFVAINASNIGRALPSLAVVAIGLNILGLGYWNVVVALVVLAWPLMLTNSFVAVDSVDPDIVEAARGMGLTPFQVLMRVELPLALPLIFAGIRTAAVYVVATATLAGVVGGGALGDIIFNQATYFFSGVIGASIVVVGLAFAADFAFAALQWLVTPRGLSHQVRRLDVEGDTPPLGGAAAA